MFGRAGVDWTADMSFTQPQSAELSFPFLFFFLIRPCRGLLPLLWIAMMALDAEKLLDIGVNRRHLQFKTRWIFFREKKKVENCLVITLTELWTCFPSFLHSHHVREIRWEKEVGGSQGSPGLLAGLRYPAGGQPGECWSRALHQTAAGSHCGQLLWAKASSGRQWPDMDGPVPGAERAGSAPGGPGPALGTGMLSHSRCPAATHLCQLRPGSDELLCRDPLHYREWRIHSEALPRLTIHAWGL